MWLSKFRSRDMGISPTLHFLRKKFFSFTPPRFPVSSLSRLGLVLTHPLVLLLEATFLASKSPARETSAVLNKPVPPQFGLTEAFSPCPLRRLVSWRLLALLNTRRSNLHCYKCSGFQGGGFLPHPRPRRTPATGYFCFVLVLPRNKLFTRSLNSYEQTLPSSFGKGHTFIT